MPTTADAASAPHDTLITLASLKQSGTLPTLIGEIAMLKLTDAGMTLVKAAGLTPGDPIWKLIERAGPAGVGLRADERCEARHESRAIVAIRDRLTGRKLRFGILTKAVYAELKETAPTTAPDEPTAQVSQPAPEPTPTPAPKPSPQPVAQPKRIATPPKHTSPPPTTKRLTPITLAEAEERYWIFGFGSIIELLGYPKEVTAELKRSGVTHVWRCYEHHHVFAKPAEHAALWRKIALCGLPPYRPLAADLIEKLKKDDLFEPLPPVAQRQTIVIPTDAELEEMNVDAIEELEMAIGAQKERIRVERWRRQIAVRAELEAKIVAETQAAEEAARIASEEAERITAAQARASEAEAARAAAEARRSDLRRQLEALT